MRIKQIAISDLTPADYNPRKDLQPGDTDYEKLRRSLTEFGYVEPVIWNKTTGNIVGGHQRLKVLADLGYKTVDCVVVELDETREKALNVVLNKISGDWDNSKLALLIADLDASDFEVELTGFDESEIQQLIGSLDEDSIEDDNFDLNAALEAAAFVEKGDIWRVGRHRLMCADATNPADVETLMDGKQANLVVTDPPYNVDFKSNSGLKIAGDKQDSDTSTSSCWLHSPTWRHLWLREGQPMFSMPTPKASTSVKRFLMLASIYRAVVFGSKTPLYLVVPHTSGSTNRCCMGGRKTALTLGMPTANKPRCGILPSPAKTVTIRLRSH